jgi:hypothetical protein
MYKLKSDEKTLHADHKLTEQYGGMEIKLSAFLCVHRGEWPASLTVWPPLTSGEVYPICHG